MISFYTGGHVLFQQVSTCYHYSSSFLLGEMKEIQEKLREGIPSPSAATRQRQSMRQEAGPRAPVSLSPLLLLCTLPSASQRVEPHCHTPQASSRPHTAPPYSGFSFQPPPSPQMKGSRALDMYPSLNNTYHCLFMC